jgi:tetratricopeptide (TPR) repeat protein
MKPRALMLLVALAAGLFAVTVVVTRAFRAEQTQLARQWMDRGNAALAASQPAVAVTAYRTALLYAWNNKGYQFKLAQALADAGKTDEAAAYFKNLWESEPGNAVVNLELARLAVRKRDFNEAMRFFHAAIYGVWPDDPATHRRRARREFIHFLLDFGATAQANAELIALEAELPSTGSAHKSAADLFMRVQDYSRALDEYRRAINLNRNDATALANAGRAAFELAQYGLAQQYLHKAVAHGIDDPSVAKLSGLVDAILVLDPDEPRLTNPERRARVLRGFEQAKVRLQQCVAATGHPLVTGALPGSNGRVAGQSAASSSRLATPAAPMTETQKEFAEWQQLRPRISDLGLLRNPDLMDTAMDLIFRIERQAGPQCGPPATADTALLELARRHEGS